MAVSPKAAATPKAAANSFDEAGRCVTALTKLWHGGCFVAGTPVTVSQLPYSPARQSALWSETDWLDEGPEAGDWRREQESRSESLLLQSSTLTLPTASGLHSRASNLLLPIEQVPLGARILTKNPRPWEYDGSLPEPDETTWAKMSITMYRTDGGIVDAEMLRPRWWIDRYGIEAGEYLPINIEELQVKGTALVTAIDDCPEIAEGEGSVVTARFCTREVHTIAQVEILGPDGQIETISGTPIHPVWSEDRQDWVPLGELEQGERLRSSAESPDSGFPSSFTSHPSSLVRSVTLINQSVPVYNIEVHGEHVYQVGELAILVHNAPLACVAIGQAGEIAGGTTGARIGIKSVLNPGRWRFPDKIDKVAKTITETKNVAYQHFSRQLRDYVLIAKDQGYQLILQVRKGDGTKISGPLQEYIDAKIIKLVDKL